MSGCNPLRVGANPARQIMKKYIMLKKNGKCIREHRYIMQKKLGRKLLQNEDVHHINGDGTDNRLKNLQIFIHGEHTIYHKKQCTKYIRLKCSYCNKDIERSEKDIKRRKEKGTKNFYCSKKCVGKACGPKIKLYIKTIVQRELKNGLRTSEIAKKI